MRLIGKRIVKASQCLLELIMVGIISWCIPGQGQRSLLSRHHWSRGCGVEGIGESTGVLVSVEDILNVWSVQKVWHHQVSCGIRSTEHGGQEANYSINDFLLLIGSIANKLVFVPYFLTFCLKGG